jgi:hypothetical protein
MDRIAIKCSNIFHCKTLPKFTQIGIFGLKICHLATLVGSVFFSSLTMARAAKSKKGL